MERRRDARYAARWTTHIVLHSEYLAMLTFDVSFHGLFLQAKTELTLGQLSRITVAPFDGERIALHVVPMRLVSIGDTFGIGARLLVVPESWERLVARLRDAARSAMRIRLAPVVGWDAPRLTAKR
jgi:hypothetical protein